MQRILKFWPLVIVAVILAAIVYKISPASLGVIPYKGLIVALAIYAAHLVDEVFQIDADGPRALVYGATVIAFALAL